MTTMNDTEFVDRLSGNYVEFPDFASVYNIPLKGNKFFDLIIFRTIMHAYRPLVRAKQNLFFSELNVFVPKGCSFCLYMDGYNSPEREPFYSVQFEELTTGS